MCHSMGIRVTCAQCENWSHSLYSHLGASSLTHYSQVTLVPHSLIYTRHTSMRAVHIHKHAITCASAALNEGGKPGRAIRPKRRVVPNIFRRLLKINRLGVAAQASSCDVRFCLQICLPASISHIPICRTRAWHVDHRSFATDLALRLSLYSCCST
jgi:hypothetical protein